MQSSSARQLNSSPEEGNKAIKIKSVDGYDKGDIKAVNAHLQARIIQQEKKLAQMEKKLALYSNLQSDYQQLITKHRVLEQQYKQLGQQRREKGQMLTVYMEDVDRLNRLIKRTPEKAEIETMRNVQQNQANEIKKLRAQVNSLQTDLARAGNTNNNSMEKIKTPFEKVNAAPIQQPVRSKKNRPVNDFAKQTQKSEIKDSIDINAFLMQHREEDVESSMDHLLPDRDF